MSKENNMCSYIHFFRSQEEAAQWLAEKGVEGTTLSIEDGYELGRRAFADLLNYVSGDVYTQASELSPLLITLDTDTSSNTCDPHGC